MAPCLRFPAIRQSPPAIVTAARLADGPAPRGPGPQIAVTWHEATASRRLLIIAGDLSGAIVALSEEGARLSFGPQGFRPDADSPCVVYWMSRAPPRSRSRHPPPRSTQRSVTRKNIPRLLAVSTSGRHQDSGSGPCCGSGPCYGMCGMRPMGCGSPVGPCFVAIRFRRNSTVRRVVLDMRPLPMRIHLQLEVEL